MLKNMQQLPKWPLLFSLKKTDLFINLLHNAENP